MQRRALPMWAWLFLGILSGVPAFAQPLESIGDVALQPLASATERLIDALEAAGAPLAEKDVQSLRRILEEARPGASLEIQSILDRYCLASVNINPESRVKIHAGPAPKVLLQGGWSTFLVKVHNEAGVTAPLRALSPNAQPVFRTEYDQPETVTPGDVLSRFLDLSIYSAPPMRDHLSGLALEYAIVQLYSRDAGPREALLAFDVGQGTQDIGFRSEVAILFDCRPAVEVTLRVLDVDDRPTTAWFVLRDDQGRIHPAPAKRLAPDFFFHHQIYRHDGESVRLPPGEYHVQFGRGPEYLTQERSLTVPVDTEALEETFRLKRWIHVAKEGWYSGDHHIHAAGCSHYVTPSEGVLPEHMMRHILGEDLNVGCVLSWGPCWYYQKQFFSGQTHELSQGDYLMRYDVEVSGFPSSHSGHLTLLRLKEDDFPGTEKIEDWPTFDLPILKWAKAQGAITGFAHSGWGLEVADPNLPNTAMPRFDGIGANEYIVDVTHDVVDFISTVDTPILAELNIWYHTLNVGYRTRISGETDFPCIYGERVGLGRSYVKLDGELDFESWVQGVDAGRSYVSDGRSHLLDFQIEGVEAGAGGVSRLDIASPKTVKVTARVAAWLDPERTPELEDISRRPLSDRPYWHIERARLGETRRVAVELIVNGIPVERREIEAAGQIVPLTFEWRAERSSWIALRVFASSHTNPIFVHVAGKPIRASRESAQWCLDAVDQCWRSKEPGIAEDEKEAARAAYEHARQAYRQRLSESDSD
ncbi:MAG: CehA/McbA family metallohydrolase [Planctomycetota bacterium]